MAITNKDGYWLWTNGPVPKGSAGLTLGKLVIVRSNKPSGRLLRHELVHVQQFRSSGMVGFLGTYLYQYLRWRLKGYGHSGAYRRIPQEIEAYWLERFPQR